ncbi:Ig-like domain-containing protein [Kluyvera intermedia]|uniref:Ig-like domain-containing protein n=1 Tax=Kluyvera intermedia TaxID=61648 RepID=UPI00352685B7
MKDENNSSAIISKLVIIKNDTPANGVSRNIVTALVCDNQSKVLPEQIVTFSASNNADIVSPAISDSAGYATTSLISTTPGESVVTATINDSSQSTVTLFRDNINDPTAKINYILVNENYAEADGDDINSIQAQVINDQGTPLNDQSVIFTVTNSANIISPVITKNGMAVTTLTSINPGVATVSATINDSTQSVDVIFSEVNGNEADAVINTIFVSRNNGIADGLSTNTVKAQIIDSNGTALPAQKVSFTATNGARIITPSFTNEKGIVTTNLTNTIPGVSTVTASINNSIKNTDVIFTDCNGNNPYAIINNLVVSINDALSNGVDINEVQAQVIDNNGTPIPGQTVVFEASNGAFIATSVPSEHNGKAIATLTSTTPGVSTVTATINNSKQQVDVVFLQKNNHVA